MDDAPDFGMEPMDLSEESALAAAVEESALEETSAQFLGRWHRLVSTTNWEKGRIISQWRQALLQAGAAVQVYGDEAWSRRVGNVSPQHVGRLRRVHEQFGEIHEQYPGLYWSHFQAALDWHDAEMWLEGAVQSGWSVARMRTERWQALGGSPEDEPGDGPIDAEIDEDAAAEEPLPEAVNGSVREVQGLEADDEPRSDFDDEDDPVPSDGEEDALEATKAVEPFRPFENLPPLPQDLADAFETFKLAILGHKLAGWQEVACGEVIAALDALKQLAIAPAEC